VSVLGGANVDLRHVQLESPEAEMTIVSVMGGANLIVPEGVDVELTGIAFMGGKTYQPGRQQPAPGAPLIRVRAFAFMGGVAVTTKRTSR
jgi:predicted membrane protein